MPSDVEAGLSWDWIIQSNDSNHYQLASFIYKMVGYYHIKQGEMMAAAAPLPASCTMQD